MSYFLTWFALNFFKKYVLPNVDFTTQNQIKISITEQKLLLPHQVPRLLHGLPLLSRLPLVWLVYAGQQGDAAAGDLARHLGEQGLALPQGLVEGELETRERDKFDQCD